MGKSSSSSKRKRSKYSSPGPTRKRSKVVRERKRSKARRGRSKKLRRCDDSDSYSTDDSSSLLSVSSSSEDSYRSRKSRSCIRKDVTGAKRRAHACSSSSEESSRFRKQKQSRRRNDSEVRKKTNRRKKKNAQRDASISYRSIGSWSCSTCQSSSESGDEGEYKSNRGRSERTGNNLRKLKNVKSRNKKERYRSRSYSSCSRHSGSDYWSEEKLTDGNMPKQLRSVITFTKNDEEGRELDWDEHKEEMAYEYDGYPSSRSNDTNDMENKRVSGHQSHDASEKKKTIENEQREDACVFNIKTTKLSDICKDEQDRYVENKPASGGFETNDVLEEKINEIANATGNVNADNLELILRQKALENLRRFRGGIQINASTTKQKDDINGASNPPSPKRADLSQNECAKDAGARGVGGDFVHSVQEEEKILDGKSGSDISVSLKNNAYQPNQVAVAGRGKVNTTFGHGITKRRLVSSALKQVLSNATTPAMEALASQVSNEAKLVTGSSVGEHDATSFNCNGNSDEINNASHSASAKSSSCLASVQRDVGLNKLQDKDKEGSHLELKTVTCPKSLSCCGNGDTVNDESGSNTAEPSSRITSAARDLKGSQLEEKTMSVMRGGEMVQVSYKVYIPKRAPALARRRLKR